jgi:hypothetical protein
MAVQKIIPNYPRLAWILPPGQMERGANKEAVENEGRPPEDGSCSYDRPLGKNVLVTAR